MTDDVSFSRSISNALFGPLDDSIDFRINGDAKIEWMQYARTHGYASLGDYIRIAVAGDMKRGEHVGSVLSRLIGGNQTNVGQTPDNKQAAQISA